jgi:hypothetical protein
LLGELIRGVGLHFWEGPEKKGCLVFVGGDL